MACIYKIGDIEFNDINSLKEFLSTKEAISMVYKTGLSKELNFAINKTNTKQAPQVGDKVSMPPRIEGGQPVVMEFTDEGWKQRVGNELTNVGESVKEDAQIQYDNERRKDINKGLDTGTVKPSVEGNNGVIGSTETGITEANVPAEEVAAPPTTENVTGETVETTTPVAKEGVESPVFNEKNKTKVQDALKDVDSTTKVLEENIDNSSIKKSDLKAIAEQFDEVKDPSINGFNESVGEAWNNATPEQKKTLQDSYWKNVSTEKAISNAYHKAKADGSNPELVKAVEDLITNTINQTTNAKEQQIGEVRDEGVEKTTEGGSDSNLPKVNETGVQDGEKTKVAEPEKTEPTKEEPTEISKVTVISNDSTESDVNDMAKSVIAALKRSEGYTDAEKQAIVDKVGEFYQTQSHEKLEQIGQAFIDELGGLDKATEEAKKSGSFLPATVKTFILGQGILNAKKMYTAATTTAEKNKWLDMQNDLWEALDESLRDMGRAMSYLQKFYAKSPIAAARKVMKDIEARNKLFEPDANKKAADIKALIESQEELKAAINEAVGEALSESKESILSLEREIERLRKEINGAKGTKKNPINLGVTKEQVSAARKRLMGKAYSNPFINPEFWKDMGILAADAIQEGAIKITDFYNYLNKTLRGKYSNTYGEIYNRAKKVAISNGAKESEFSTDEEVESETDRLQKETDAKKITKLSEMKAKLSKMRSQEKVTNDDSPEYKEAESLSSQIDELNKKAESIRKKEAEGVINTAEKERLKRLQNAAKEKGKREEELRLSIAKAAEEAAKERIKLEDELQKEREKIAKIREEEKNKVLNNVEKERLRRAQNEAKARAKEIELEYAKKQKEEKQRLKELERKLNIPSVVANRIVSDAKVNLNNETTKKEQDALTKVMNTIVKKASELTKVKDKPLGQKASDMVAFALAEAGRAKKIYNEAQTEVFKQIDADPNLTEDEKTALKDFLDKYKESNFDILLSRGQKDKIIRDKLIELGYAKQVNGKVVLNLDPLIAKVKTVDQAVSEMVKSLSNETGISEQDLQEFADSIRPRLNELVAEKKTNMINAYLRKNERYRAARLLKNNTRKTRVQKLLELYNAGGLTDKRVKDALSEELGITTFTAEDEAWLAKKFEEADKAPSGAELEKIEEEIQAYLEHKGGGILDKQLFERVRARLLSSPLTALKNLSGGLETMIMTIEKLIKTNKRNILNPKNFDTTILKVIKDSKEMAFYTAMDILVNGGVDLGTAFSEATNTKEGTPRVRYTEYGSKKLLPDVFLGLGGTRVNANIYNSLLDKEKFIGRTLAFPDTINQIMLQEMKAYSFIKNSIQNQNPSLSDKEASQMAYDQMYATSIDEATAKATKEFKDRGIDLDLSKPKDFYRFNRRVYEIVQQSRGEEVIKQASDFAGRYTYKISDTGIMTPVSFLMTQIKTMFTTSAAKLRKMGDKDPEFAKAYDRVAKMLETTGEVLFTTHMPFIKGVANILEKGLELFPLYGYPKAAGYLTPVAFTKNKQKQEELLSKAGEFAIRATFGLALMSLFLGIADDDENDGEVALYGAGDEDFKKQQAIKVVRPANTIKIGGKNINLDYLGSLGVSLKAQAALMDLKRYQEKYSKLSDEEKAMAQAQAVAQTILLGSYTQGLFDLVSKPSSGVTEREKAKAAEVLTRFIIPFTAFSRQLMQAIDPKAKKAIGLKENLAKYSGLVAGWSLDRPAFDYRGREYNTGQIYSGSPDAFVQMLTTMDKLSDDYDTKIMKYTNYDLSFTTISKDDEKYYIIDKETGKERKMTEEEYYEVSKVKNQIFDERVRGFIDMIDGKSVDGEQYSKEEQEAYKNNPKQIKKIIEQINNQAKRDAFIKVFNEAPIKVEQEATVIGE